MIELIILRNQIMKIKETLFVFLFYENLYKHMNNCSNVLTLYSKKHIILYMNNHSSVKEQKMKNNEKCDCTIIHNDIINEVKDNLPKENTIQDISKLFKTIGDETRSKILWALNASEMCVCDISVLLNMSQSAISHQLRVLKEQELVKNRREGKIIYYSLKDEHVKQIFEMALIHVNELK